MEMFAFILFLAVVVVPGVGLIVWRVSLYLNTLEDNDSSLAQGDLDMVKGNLDKMDQSVSASHARPPKVSFSQAVAQARAQTTATLYGGHDGASGSHYSGGGSGGCDSSSNASCDSGSCM